jgi:hypothetical protein
MNKSEIMGGFNNHLAELLESLIEIIPENKELKAALASLVTIRKANPKLIIITWKEYVLEKYEENIMSGDVEYFLEKDYSDDVKDTGDAANILDKIIVIKNTMKGLDETNLDKTVTYLQNLTKLCKVYFLQQ